LRIGLFFPFYFSRVGDELDVQAIARELSNNGHQVVVYCGAKKAPKGQTGRISSTLEIQAHGRRTQLIIPSREIIRRLARNADKIDLLHLFCGFIPAVVPAACAAKLSGIPLVYSTFGQLHQTSIDRSPAKKKLFIMGALRPLAHACAAVHAISPSEAAQLVRLGFPARTVAVVPLGLHAIPDSAVTLSQKPPDAAMRRHFAAEEPHLVALFLGRADVWQKSLDLVIAALAEAGQTRSQSGNDAQLPLHFYVAGPDANGGQEQLRRLAAEHGVTDRVHFLGLVPEDAKWEMMRSCDIFVHPSRVEGFARSLREAISMGTPILVTPETNMGELVAEHQAGSVCHLDVTDIAETFRSLREAPEQLSRWRRNVPALRARLAWPRVMSEMVDVYERVC
jgi:glycosyltransferase involved in cell wall biosynthesis